MADAPATTEDDAGDELLLPPADDRKWLLDRLGEVVARGGIAPLVAAPLLEPTDEFFPDPWAGGEASLRRLVRRLLGYAGLPDTEVAVTIHEDGPSGPAVSAGAISPVWFDGVREGRLHFSAAGASLRSALVFVPATARAVAEAWRVHHGLKVSDDGPLQRLVDVTAVYLGFGRLTLDAAIRHHVGTTMGLRGGARSRTRLGLLSPMAIAWLLGAVVVVRELDDKTVRRLAKSLQPNPAAFLREAIAQHRAAREPVRARLGLPDPETWPPPYDLEVLTAPLPADDEDADVEQADPDRHADKGAVGLNEGQPVFRVQRSKALRLAKMLALPTVMLGMLAGRMQMGFDVPMWQIGAIAAGLGLVGLAVGRMLPDSRCSEPKCGTTLSPNDTICPRCKGTVRGVISHPRERLAAEEALRAEEGTADDDDGRADDDGARP